MIIKIVKGDIVVYYSNGGFLIKQIETGLLYSRAVDLVESSYHYEETNIPANLDEPEEEIDLIRKGG